MEENYSALTLKELKQIAKQKGVKNISSYRKNELIKVLNEESEENKPKESKDQERNSNHSDLERLDSGEVKEGILEVMPDGFGFIRCDNYLPG